MTRANASLQPHLLTRSDLEQLQVPSHHVSAWLADGSLEPAGNLPGDAATDGEPVFAVTTNALRQDLALRLLAIDKPVVVMTPPRVRSLLQRFAATPGPSHQAAHEEALAAVVAEVQADVGELLQFAAPTPAPDRDADEDDAERVEVGDDAADDDVHLDLDASADDERAGDHEDADEDTVEGSDDDEAEGDADDDGGACFDTGDLERVLDAFPAPVPTAPPAPDPAPVAAPATAANDTTMVTEAESAVLQPAPAARPTPVAFLPAPEAGDVVLAATIGRVDAFLERLQHSLLELARQPSATAAASPPATDVTPIVQAMQAGFERVVQSAATTHGALQALGQGIGGIGAQLAAGVDKTLRTALATRSAPEAPPPPPAPAPAQPLPTFAPTITLPRQERLPAALLALAACVLAWSLLFWWKTDSQQLAVGTLVGANLIGCCLLAARRARA